MDRETIFALATPRGKSGVAVVRLSGPRVRDALGALQVGALTPRRAHLRDVRAPGGELLDRGVVILFEAGASFTGEDVAELQLHGSPAVIQAVLGALGALPGLRAAEPGEFTRRALEENRLDLTQVEGLADLIDAETEAQRRKAQAVLDGSIGATVAGWRDDIVRAAALLEATIDFADEDVPVDVYPEVRGLIARVLSSVRAEIAGFGVAERVRDGFVVAIVGAPNVGKSTLLNYLAGREAAITSSVAGTTRDVIEVRMDLGGLPVTLLDTAGLRDTDDMVERQGVARALDRANSADVRVLLAEEAEDWPTGMRRDGDDIHLLPKRDTEVAGGVSGLTGAGVKALVGRLEDILSRRTAGAGMMIRQRHLEALKRAESALGLAEIGLEEGSEGPEMVAENLRACARALDGLIGRVDVEHLLGEIFARFCIGK